MYKIIMTGADGEVRAEYTVKDYGIYDGDILTIKAVAENDEKILISFTGMNRVTSEKI